MTQRMRTDMRHYLRRALWILLVNCIGSYMAVLGQVPIGDFAPVAGPHLDVVVETTVCAMTGSRELGVIAALGTAFGNPANVDVRGDYNASLPRFCDSDKPFDILVSSC